MKPWTIPNSAGEPSWRLSGVGLHSSALQVEPAGAGGDEQHAEDDPDDRRRGIASPHDQRDADQHHQDREERAPHSSGRPFAATVPRAFSGAGADSMITRHGPLGQHGLQRLAEQRRAVDALRQRHHDRRRAHVGGLLDDPAPGLPDAHPLDVPGHPRARLHARLLDQRLRRGLLLGHRRVDRQRARHGDHRNARGCPAGAARRAWPRSRSRTRRSARRSSARAPSRTRPRGRRPAAGSRPCASRSGPAPAGGGRAGRRPCRGSASRRRSRRRPGAGTTVTTNADRGAEAADHGEHRDVAPADLRVPGRPVGPWEVGLGHPQADHREVGDRERQHRAERVEVAEERRLARERDRGSRSPPKTRIPIHGVRYFGCSCRSWSGSWRWMPIE